MQGPAYWLNPKTRLHFRVIEHATWIFDHKNARSAGLPERYIRAIRQFDPIRNEDEVRLLAVMGGLVRTREHFEETQYTTVQFYAGCADLFAILAAVAVMLRETSADQFADVRLHNLRFNGRGHLYLDQLVEAVESQQVSDLCNALCQSTDDHPRLCELVDIVQKALDTVSRISG